MSKRQYAIHHVHTADSWVTYFPVETIVITIELTLIGWIRYSLKMKGVREYRTNMKGAYERLTDPDYAKPRWFTSPPAVYAMTAIIIALLVYFY